MINDYVDYAVEQGEWAAESTVLHIENKGLPTSTWRKVVPNKNVRLAVPQYVSGDRDVLLYLRVTEPLENVQLVIPEIGKNIPQIRVAPSIMLKIKLRKEDLSKTYDTLRIEVLPR